MKLFFLHTWLFTKRSVITTLRNPFAFIPNVMISLFFLLVYQAGLSGISKLPAFDGASYLAFILPVAIVSGAISGAGGAGQSLITDLENGYFSRLLLTPASRLAIVLGPIIAGMLQLLLQTVLIVAVAFLMGLSFETGFLGLLVLLLLAVGWGLAFAGYSVGFALRTKNAQAAQAGTFIFFPLLFLSTTFVPYDLIQSDWLQIAALINPTTYVFEGMRALLIDGWGGSDVWIAFGVIVLICAVTITFATMSAKRAVSRG